MKRMDMESGRMAVVVASQVGNKDQRNKSSNATGGEASPLLLPLLPYIRLLLGSKIALLHKHVNLDS